MRYKKPKYSNYKKFNGGGGNREPMSGKRKLIIGIIIGVAALLVIAAIVAAVLWFTVLNADNDEPPILPPISDVESNEIENIQVIKLPSRVLYYCGDEFDPTGLKVYALTKGLSGDFISIDLEECTITGFDSSAPVESQTITVKYREFTDTFAVEIREKPALVFGVESIAIETLPKTEYKLGEWLDTKGGTFICTYTDGSTKTIEMKNKNVSGFKPAMDQGVGEYDLRVLYSENGVQVETTYKIKITQ